MHFWNALNSWVFGVRNWDLNGGQVSPWNVHFRGLSIRMAEFSLVYNSTHELLVATILSAQCTDNRVNTVTEILFQKYKSPDDFAYCNVNELSKDIHSCGYHNQKARNIHSASFQKCPTLFLKNVQYYRLFITSFRN